LLRSSNNFPQAGLNLNLFAALSGAFSGKSKKTKNTAEDGSSVETEDTRVTGHANGVGAGNLSAVGQAQAQSSERHRKLEGYQQDHLGLEGGKVESAAVTKK
jgi:hypothetical protein